MTFTVSLVALALSACLAFIYFFVRFAPLGYGALFGVLIGSAALYWSLERAEHGYLPEGLDWRDG